MGDTSGDSLVVETCPERLNQEPPNVKHRQDAQHAIVEQGPALRCCTGERHEDYQIEEGSPASASSFKEGFHVDVANDEAPRPPPETPGRLQEFCWLIFNMVGSLGPKPPRRKRILRSAGILAGFAPSNIQSRSQTGAPAGVVAAGICACRRAGASSPADWGARTGPALGMSDAGAGRLEARPLWQTKMSAAMKPLHPVGPAFQPAGSPGFPTRCSFGGLESPPNRQAGMPALPAPASAATRRTLVRARFGPRGRGGLGEPLHSASSDRAGTIKPPQTPPATNYKPLDS